MYAAVEHGPVLCSDSNILCLSWKGRVPKSEKEKPVCRRRYYEEGWLATGNGRGVVGVTFTSSHCRRDRNTPQRINFNLRGHNSEVVLVRWNEPYQKLATCDADGGIFVWIQYEGRWSVELVNDRGAQVSDFTWSHDGTQALISYRDGFVLVGSVSGQRHWSSEINLESQITCGIWTPDDQQVLFGTADGQVIVMDCHGRMLAHVLLHESDGILSMSWNCPAFLVEDSSESDTDSDDYSPPQDGPAAYPIPVQNIKPLLTVSFTSGDISLMNNYDDLSPTVIRSGLKEVVAQWCTQGDLLAVSGMERQTQLGDLPNGPLLKSAMVKFYNVRGEHIFTLDTLVQRPIVSICWGHRDSRLLMASGPALYVVRVEHRVSSLQLLCQQAIASALREDKDISKLTLPPRLCSYLSTAFIPTIKPPIPDPNNMRDFVSYPSAGNERLHCTMKRTEDDPEVGGPCYTLYLEYLGGLVPILKGRRISKLRPEFVIMDPRTDSKSDEIYGNSLISAMLDSCNCSDSSDIELSDDWAAKKSPKISRASKSPKLPRINIEARKSPKLSRAAQEMSRSPRLPMRKPSIGSPSLTRREFPFEDITQHNYLAQVTSNIWGTKFKIVGLAAFLPTNLGAVIYKTSLLHLQPRQMTIYLPEVRKISMDYVNLPVFNPNVFSEDEDDLPVTGASGVPENNPPCTVNIPIAPIHSSAQAMSPTQSIGLVQSLLANQNVQLDVLTNQTTAVGTSEHGSDSATQYPVSNRYSNPGQVIFGGVEMGRIIPNPAQLSLPPPAPGAIQLSVLDHGDRDHDHLQKSTKALRPVPQLAAEGDAVVFSAPQEVQVAKMNPPPPYPGPVQNPQGTLPPKAHLVVEKPLVSPPPTDLQSHLGTEVMVETTDNFQEVLSLTESPVPQRSEKFGKKNRKRLDSRAEEGNVQAITEGKVKKEARTLSDFNSLISSPRLGREKKKVKSQKDQLKSKKLNKTNEFQDSSESEPELFISGDELMNQTQGSKKGWKSKRSLRTASELEEFKCRKASEKEDGRLGSQGFVYVMANKQPLWNEATQVYQLDFGGRVTQESAKNFQIELEGRQVMQFGRIDGNAYILDFQYPFSAVQAFAVALANVTQRLK
ncbi:tubby-related protein 4 [Puma concolor]|uniref:Tubby-related protein 4 n=1 Tax=Puma concolor TaxID=9696 RepID=A0A6P6HZQ6_PUMCO|nr:tubby-related protein 4 [Puma concolor]